MNSKNLSCPKILLDGDRRQRRFKFFKLLCRKTFSIFKLSSLTKVIQIVKCTCTVFIDNFRNISTDSLIQVSVCRRSCGGYVKHKRNDPMCDPWDSQGNEKMQLYFHCF